MRQQPLHNSSCIIHKHWNPRFQTIRPLKKPGALSRTWKIWLVISFDGRSFGMARSEHIPFNCLTDVTWLFFHMSGFGSSYEEKQIQINDFISRDPHLDFSAFAPIALLGFGDSLWTAWMIIFSTCWGHVLGHIGNSYGRLKLKPERENESQK